MAIPATDQSPDESGASPASDAGDNDTRTPSPASSAGGRAAASTQSTDDGGGYLHVTAHYGWHRSRWNVFQISDQSPRVSLAGSIDSCEQACNLAAGKKRPLRISQQAWQQMLNAGVAPPGIPRGVTIV
jgi:hypothetical protein